MSNVIQFLEDLGRGSLSLQEGLSLNTIAAGYNLSEDAIRALQARDNAALSTLVGGRPTMICALFPAEPEPSPDEDEPSVPAEQSPEVAGSSWLH